MKTFGTLFILALLTPTLALAQANVAAAPSAKTPAEIAKIKTLLPTGEEIAGAYQLDYDAQTNSSTIDLRQGKEYTQSVSGNFAFADVNGDGTIDLVVAVEDAPTKDESGPNFGARKLLIFLGDSAGHLKLSLESDKVLLGAGDGGVFGDPFDGVTVNAKGVITLNDYGGSADRWGDTQKFEYRHGDFYLIGLAQTEMNDITMIGSATDVNLLTGQELLTQFRGPRAKDIVTHKQLAVKPLVKLTDAKNPMGE